MPADRLVEQLKKGFLGPEDWVSEGDKEFSRIDHHPVFAGYFIPGDRRHEDLFAARRARQDSMSDYRKREVTRTVVTWGAIAVFIALVPLAAMTKFTVLPEDTMNALVSGGQEAWKFASTKVRKAFDQEAATLAVQEERELPGGEEIARVRAFFPPRSLEGEAQDRLEPAWEALLNGTSSGVVAARQLLEQAVSLDPDHAGALGGLALVYAMQTQADPALSKSSVNLLQRGQALGAEEPGVLRAESGISVVNKAYTQAVSQANKCLNLMPGDGICSWYLGEGQLGLGKHREAVRALVDAERVLEGPPAVRMALAKASLATSDYARASAELEALAVVSPEDPAVLELRARVARDVGAFGAALDFATRAADHDPLRVDARLLQGELLLYREGKANAAFGVLSELADSQLNLGELNGRVLLQASNAARAAGRHDQALAYGRRALEILPGWAPAQLSVALSHEAQGDMVAAEEALKQADNTSVSGRAAAPVHLRTALFFAGQDRQRLAEDELQRALDADRSYAPVHLQLVTTYFRLDSMRRGLELLKALYAVDLEREMRRDPVALSWFELPPLLPLYTLLDARLKEDARLASKLPRCQGILLTVDCLTSGNCAKAVQRLDQALRVDESDPAAMTMMGRVQLRNGQYEVATNYLRRAAQSANNEATVNRLLGEALLGLGRLSGAEDALKRALGGDSEDPGTHEAYAAVLYAGGRASEAATHIESARVLDPASFVPRKLLLENGETE